MQDKVLSPDGISYVHVLKACGSMGATEKGEKIHEEIVAHGLIEKDLIVANAVIDMYTSFGFVQKAQEVFNNLPLRNVVSWNTIIGGYAEHEFGQEALNCYLNMRVEGFSSDVSTFTFILKGCDGI